MLNFQFLIVIPVLNMTSDADGSSRIILSEPTGSTAEVSLPFFPCIPLIYVILCYFIFLARTQTRTVLFRIFKYSELCIYVFIYIKCVSNNCSHAKTVFFLKLR